MKKTLESTKQETHTAIRVSSQQLNVRLTRCLMSVAAAVIVTGGAWFQVWDVRSNQLVQHYSAHSGPVTNVAFHPSGDFLLSSSLDTTLKVPSPLLPPLLCSLVDA